MNESVSNAMVLTIVIIVIGVSCGITLFSLGYSKTYKIKNKIIDIIEKHGTYNDGDVRDEIEAYLRSANYSSEANYTGGDGACPAMDGVAAINTLRNYRYCIYRHQTVKGDYYTVKTYQTYNFPLIGDIIKVRYSITGDTQVLLELQP